MSPDFASRLRARFVAFVEPFLIEPRRPKALYSGSNVAVNQGSIAPVTASCGSETAQFLQANKLLRKRVQIYMKKIGAIVAAALLSLYAMDSADAAGPLQEGPLHWTARHVREAAVETGDTLHNVARTATRTIHHRTRVVRHALSS